MPIINLHTARRQLSRLVEEAAAGKEIIIAKAGKPVARLVPLQAKNKERQLGLLAGQLKIPVDFDGPMPSDVLDIFEVR